MFGFAVGGTAAKAKLERAVTVILALSIVLPAVTWTAPPVTIVPAQELKLLLPLLDNTVLLRSVNVQLEKTMPVGAPVTLQVALPPRATEEGQLSFMTLSPPAGAVGWMGHEGLKFRWIEACAADVVAPTATPVWFA